MTKKELQKIECRILNRIRRNAKVIVKDELEQDVYDYLMGIKQIRDVFTASLAAKGIEIN